MTTDYKDTIFLPRTAFPMRAGLPKKEPELLARWRQLRGDEAARLPEQLTLRYNHARFSGRELSPEAAAEAEAWLRSFEEELRAAGNGAS